MNFNYENVKGKLEPFIFETYASIVRILSESLVPSTFNQYRKTGRLFLRHDIDTSIQKTIDLAQFEKELGIQSTYFIQPNSDFYNLSSTLIIEMVNKIIEYGHIIGLHIDATVCESVGISLQEYIDEQFDYYSKYFKLSPIISFHRPPKTVMGNMHFKNCISTYSTEYFSDIRYFSDSKRRNFIPELLESFSHDKNTSIQLLVHPEWWSKKETLDLEQLYGKLKVLSENLLQEALVRNIAPFRELFDKE